MNTVVERMCFVVGLSASLFGCGSHVWLKISGERATRNADDFVELKASISDTQNEYERLNGPLASP